MDNNEISILKNTSEAVKNFSDVIQKFFQPSPLDLAIAEGHKQIIENAIDGKKINPDVVDFLCGYKKYIKQQKRCKSIANKAKEFIENTAEPENISEDWLEFFFDKAKLVCNDDMQLIWAKLLSEEANNPGTINPSLLHTMSIMRYDQALFFSNISRFVLREFKKDNVHLLIFIRHTDSDITPSKLKDLERLGLIECNFEKEYIFKNKKWLTYGNKVLTIFGDPKNNKKIKAGNVIFTYDGEKLYSLINQSCEYRSEILDYIIQQFKSRNCRICVNGKEIM